MSKLNPVTAFDEWFSSLKVSGGFPPKGTIAGALIVLDRLKGNLDLSIDGHTAKGGSQIIGASGAAVKKILADFGETRDYVSEGGRTNRGLRGAIKNLLDSLASSDIHELDDVNRIQVLEGMQERLVVQVRAWHDKQQIKLIFDEQKTTRDLVNQILLRAKEAKIAGPVAQYLVGAKLQMRYPELDIDNDSYSTADSQLGRSGDFVLMDTAFHVTIAPMGGVYDRCRQNLEQGMRAYLLVPADILLAAKQNADSVAPHRISVEAIESFVGGNVDELSRFSKTELTSQLRELISIYNKRVDAIEIDKSMLIEVPNNILSSPRRLSTPRKASGNKAS